MKALIVYGPGKYELTDVPIPKIKEDEVLVKVGAASICHSDLNILDGIRTQNIKTPVIPGHEFAGTIVEAGSCVNNIKPGDRVACQNIKGCGTCRCCRNGYTNICMNFSEIGTMENGGFAEYVAVPGRLVYRFDNISMNDASNIEPAGNAYHAVELADIKEGDNVAVIGPGPIGLYTVQMAKLKYPEKLIMVGTRDNRLEAASKLGATHIININKANPQETIMKLTENKGVDKIIQCAASKEALLLSLKIAGDNSRIIIEGINENNSEIPVNFNEFIFKPMAIIGASGVSVRHFESTVILMERGFITTEYIITHKIPLDKILEGFEMLRKRKDGVIKIVVNP